jgi:hypothetical protein
LEWAERATEFDWLSGKDSVISVESTKSPEISTSFDLEKSWDSVMTPGTSADADADVSGSTEAEDSEELGEFAVELDPVIGKEAAVDSDPDGDSSCWETEEASVAESRNRRETASSESEETRDESG